MEKKKNEKKKSSWWYWVIIILIVLYLYGEYRDRWEEENCELTFYKYTYEIGCAGTCSVKCSDEGFHSASSGYFEPYLTAEQMDDENLYKRCECNCGGCRG